MDAATFWDIIETALASAGQDRPFHESLTDHLATLTDQDILEYHERALSPSDGPSVGALPDGRLWLLRDAYAAETAWAPPPHRERTTPSPPRRR